MRIEKLLNKLKKLYKSKKEKCELIKKKYYKLWLNTVKYRLYAYSRVTSLRSLGIDAPFPENARTFMEFLERSRLDGVIR